jgi:hypothetical protein
VAVDDVAKYVLLTLENPDTHGKMIRVGGPENLSNKQVVALYERVSERKAKVSHMPRFVLSIMSRLLRPFHPGLSQAMAASLYFDMHGEFFDMTPTLQLDNQNQRSAFGVTISAEPDRSHPGAPIHCVDSLPRWGVKRLVRRAIE